jgi:hypothetical protein
MAFIDPLFVPSRLALKQALRLSGVPDLDAADYLLDQAVRRARSGFYRKLTHARVVTLQGYSLSSPPNPDSTQEYLRLMAEDTEVDWVRLELTYLIPLMHQDSSGDALDQWNEVAPFRKMDTEELEMLRSHMIHVIEQNLDMLSGDEVAGSEITIRGEVVEPEEKPPSLGDSLWSQ